MNEFNVTFKYHIGQEVYFLYKNYPKKGYISNINIRINNMEYDDGLVIEPIIEYRISGKEILWFRENDIWEDKKAFKKWIDKNLCYTKYIDHKENTCTWNNKKVRLVEIIERINNKHPWKKKKIAVIFYVDENNKGYFRYVLYEDIKNLIYENNYIGDTKYDLMKFYGTNYIEDEIYNFVNYDGIKY